MASPRLIAGRHEVEVDQQGQICESRYLHPGRYGTPEPPRGSAPYPTRTASESVGWLNGDGPLAVSPTIEVTE